MYVIKKLRCSSAILDWRLNYFNQIQALVFTFLTCVHTRPELGGRLNIQMSHPYSDSHYKIRRSHDRHIFMMRIPHLQIKNNTWITVNYDFGVTSEAICTSSLVKLLANRITSDTKIVMHGNECIILFFTCYSMSLNAQFSEKQLSIADFAIVTEDGLFWFNIVTSPQLICDVTRTRVTGIVTSYSSIVLARANWRKSDLH